MARMVPAALHVVVPGTSVASPALTDEAVPEPLRRGRHRRELAARLCGSVLRAVALVLLLALVAFPERHGELTWFFGASRLHVIRFRHDSNSPSFYQPNTNRWLGPIPPEAEVSIVEEFEGRVVEAVRLRSPVVLLDCAEDLLDWLR